MGLLSDPEAGPSKWANILVNYHRPFCFLLCVTGFVWLCILAHRPFNNGNSFSENALLPGLVRSEFVDDGTARRFLHDFQEELKENYATRDTMPVPWLAAKMRQLNLDVYTHNFTLNFPLGKKQKFQGENVYGILRAGRSASTEALVISVPYRPLSSHHKPTNAGIALMLAMAKFARSRKYWAKDLIFLVTAHEQLGAQAWLQAYHDTGGPSSWLDAGQLRGRAGAIQAAINLEMSSLRFNYMEIKIEGLNGQLPNLDLVTLVHKMCVQAGVHHSYKYSHSWTLRFDQWDNYVSSVKTLFAMIATQVTGVPTGNHGLFHRYGIEAVTLMAVGENGGHGRPAHTLEAALRSLNNLLERFHQSYFFYLRTGIDRFLSISQYMPPLGLLVAATFIRAFAMWLVSQKHIPRVRSKESNKTEETAVKDTEETNEESDSKSESKETQESGDVLKTEVKNVEDTMNHLDLLNVLIVFLLVHVIGYLVMSSPQLISEIGVEFFSLPTEESIFYGLCIISVLLIVFLPFILRKILNSGDETNSARRSTTKPLLIMSLLEIGTMMLCVGMHNFPLGFTLGCLYSPIVLFISSGNDKHSRLRWVSKLLWILVHPFMVIVTTVYLYTYFTFPDEKFSVLMSRGFTASQQAIMFAIVDGMIYGNWLFNVVTLILLPTWLIFWQILNF